MDRSIDTYSYPLYRTEAVCSISANVTCSVMCLNPSHGLGSVQSDALFFRVLGSIPSEVLGSIPSEVLGSIPSGVYSL